ncbi:MAG: 4-hydroxy-tetrahydrodipicolinate synthase [Clostridia bacterium]|nr:4-hydroxy-tetrahydrodipicolinate synthase [Clostridia bacterium]
MKKSKKELFQGCATAILTPFRDGEVDIPAFKRLIRCQLDGGVDAIVVAGTTGEAPTLDRDERALLFRVAVSEVSGQIPVIAGTGSNDTRHTVIFSKQAEEAGCDGVLAVVPYYNKGTEEGLYRHFAHLADEINIPVMVYNVPSRTGGSISVTTLKRLSEHENIVGIKEASGQINRSADIIAACGDSLPVFSGNDDMVVPLVSIGGRGVVSVISNLLPREMKQMCDLALSGDFAAAAKIQIELMPLINALFCEVNPVPVKMAATMMGLCRPTVRLPLTEASDATKERLRILLDERGLI